MSYRLYRLADAAHDLRGAELLGEFDAFDDALVARDDDTLRLFADTDPGELLHAHHQILGPGILGPDTAHPVITALERPCPASETDVADARAWLRHIHHIAGG